MKKILTALLCMTLVGCTITPAKVIERKQGYIHKVTTQQVEDSSALAAIGGAAIGGLLGNQIGGGSGKYIATAVGAVGGAAAGNAASKRMITKYTYYIKLNDYTHERWVTKKVALSKGTRVGVVYYDNGRKEFEHY